jgi:hypothetical protein
MIKESGFQRRWYREWLLVLGNGFGMIKVRLVVVGNGGASVFQRWPLLDQILVILFLLCKEMLLVINQEIVAQVTPYNPLIW